MSSQEMRDKGYFDLFGSIYRLLQTADTNNWNIIVSEADKICQEYKDTSLSSLSNELTMSVIKELERSA